MNTLIKGSHVGQFQFKAGDDARALKWMDIDESLNLYASHKIFLMLAAKRLGAHWRKVKPDTIKDAIEN